MRNISSFNAPSRLREGLNHYIDMHSFLSNVEFMVQRALLTHAESSCCHPALQWVEGFLSSEQTGPNWPLFYSCSMHGHPGVTGSCVAVAEWTGVAGLIPGRRGVYHVKNRGRWCSWKFWKEHLPNGYQDPILWAWLEIVSLLRGKHL